MLISPWWVGMGDEMPGCGDLDIDRGCPKKISTGWFKPRSAETFTGEKIRAG